MPVLKRKMGFHVQGREMDTIIYEWGNATYQEVGDHRTLSQFDRMYGRAYHFHDFLLTTTITKLVGQDHDH